MLISDRILFELQVVVVFEPPVPPAVPDAAEVEDELKVLHLSWIPSTCEPFPTVYPDAQVPDGQDEDVRLPALSPWNIPVYW